MLYTLPQKFSKYFCSCVAKMLLQIKADRYLSQMYSHQYNLHFYDSLHLFAAVVRWFSFVLRSDIHYLLTELHEI